MQDEVIEKRQAKQGRDLKAAGTKSARRGGRSRDMADPSDVDWVSTLDVFEGAGEGDKWVGELYNRPGHLLRRAHQIAMALYIEEAQGFGVTQLQYVMLRAIHHYPGQSHRRLSVLTAVDRTTVGWVVASLEAKQLVVRVSDPSDRRVKRLELTALGLGRLKKINARMPRLQQRILEPLTETERRSFMHCLRKIVLTNNRFSRAPLRPMAQVPKPSRLADSKSRRIK
jgi:DNA-binding MarR family transcriptional regulator